jgi:Ribbon-helix-helix protein, copG family
MPRKPAPSAPLTFDLPDSLGVKIERVRKRLKLPTASEAIRRALVAFDFEGYVPPRDPNGQVSVRIPAELRARLRRAARHKKISIGELIRAAIEAQARAPARSV